MIEGLQRSGDGTGAGSTGAHRPVVVVGVDGSPGSRSAALAASSVARSLGGTVVAVHVPTLSTAHAMACWLGAGYLVAKRLRPPPTAWPPTWPRCSTSRACPGG